MTGQRPLRVDGAWGRGCSAASKVSGPLRGGSIPAVGRIRGGGGGWHVALVYCGLRLAAPIGRSPFAALPLDPCPLLGAGGGGVGGGSGTPALSPGVSLPHRWPWQRPGSAGLRGRTRGAAGAPGGLSRPGAGRGPCGRMLRGPVARGHRVPRTPGLGGTPSNVLRLVRGHGRSRGALGCHKCERGGGGHRRAQTGTLT